MCSNPITKDGETFACRVCNDCIAERKNEWVARCMAEKAICGEAFCIELTYRNNSDGSTPDAAKAFKYNDVQNFLKRLRRAYVKQYGFNSEIRYIVAGERGSNRNRVHWHMVLFSQHPLSDLGSWSDFLYTPIATKPPFQKMIHWSMWDHGHVYLKPSDQGGISYALKYALKDQFAVTKSLMTARAAKSENTAAGMFRMSKKPPIGFRYLEHKISEWSSRLVVPVSLKIQIPDYSGYWWPKGVNREYLLYSLHHINEEHNQKYGKDCPQWSTLISSIQLTKDEEALLYGPDEEAQTGIEIDIPQFRLHLQRQTQKRAQAAKILSLVRRCTGHKTCRACFLGQDRETRARFKAWYFEQKEAFVIATSDRGKDDYTCEDWVRSKIQINPFCVCSDTPELLDAVDIARKAK